MNLSNKPKRQSHDLITMMRDEKGVRFTIMDETEAAHYIKETNNYLRTASYRKNYAKYQKGANTGKYENLEFAYLTELSTLDMYLRNILLKMCIDVEHSLKAKLIATVEDNPDEDGYSIVKMFFDNNPDVILSIEKKADAIFTDKLIAKYFNLCQVFDLSPYPTLQTKIAAQDCPIWVLVELLSFGDTIKLVDLYNKVHKSHPVSFAKKGVLNPIKQLRNSCAHNNCLLNDMNVGVTQPTHEISRFIASIPTIGLEERQKKLSCRPFFEIVCLIKAYNEFVSEKVRKRGMSELKDFANNRLMRHSDYFDTNQVVKTSFDFLKKVLDSIKIM